MAAALGIHLLRTGECVGDVCRLAPLYGLASLTDIDRPACKRLSPQ